MWIQIAKKYGTVLFFPPVSHKIPLLTCCTMGARETRFQPYCILVYIRADDKHLLNLIPCGFVPASFNIPLPLDTQETGVQKRKSSCLWLAL